MKVIQHSNACLIVIFIDVDSDDVKLARYDRRIKYLRPVYDISSSRDVVSACKENCLHK